ncbi:MAG: hypothetical protein TREMPRED_004644 [Tremellales sp. Tagirdzhanova-0007]|nr:MAG: hypothetical protein TREMPRED_004644 [Tremellales sp. Tagirdzhanova-0007]
MAETAPGSDPLPEADPPQEHSRDGNAADEDGRSSGDPDEENAPTDEEGFSLRDAIGTVVFVSYKLATHNASPATPTTSPTSTVIPSPTSTLTAPKTCPLSTPQSCMNRPAAVSCNSSQSIDKVATASLDSTYLQRKPGLDSTTLPQTANRDSAENQDSDPMTIVIPDT